MHEEEIVHAVYLAVSVLSNQATGTACPENVSRLIILTIIFFRGVKNSSTAKRVAKEVYHSTGRTSMFQDRMVCQRKQLWLATGNSTIRFHHLHQGLYKSRRHLHV